MLEHGGDGHRVHPGLPGLQRLAVVAKGAVRLTGRHQLHDVDLRAAHFNFDIETGVLIQPGGLGLIIPPLFRLGVPGGQQNDFLLGLNGQRDTAESHQAQPAYAPGKACACFHIPLLFTPGGGASECGSASHPGQH